MTWEQYASARHRAIAAQRARAVLAADVLNTALAGDITALKALASAPSVVRHQPDLMREGLVRFKAENPALFTASIGWIDLGGVQQISTDPVAQALHVDVHDRTFVRAVLRSGLPYVSEGLVGRVHGRRLIVIAVPTHDRSGSVTGVIAGSIEVVPAAQPSRSALDLGFAGLELLDRNGVSLLSGFRRPANTTLVGRMRTAPASGAVILGAGLNGGDDDIVAYAQAPVGSWTVAIDRPAAAVIGSAQQQLTLSLASIALAATVVLGLLVLLRSRARHEALERQRETDESAELTGNLTGASTMVGVAEALAEFLTLVLPDVRGAVAWDPVGDGVVSAVAATGPWDRPPGRRRKLFLLEAARLAQAGEAVMLERVAVRSAFGDLPAEVSDALGTLHTWPLVAPDGAMVGAIVLITAEGRDLTALERDRLATHCRHAAKALDRARQHEREHAVAVQLQRGLLADRVPTVPGLELAARYQAGAETLEIGGDWYDVVARGDGLVHLVVGDVAGHGLNAAIVMGQLRTAFRAYAFDHDSPAVVMGLLTRHVPDDAMVTVVCGTVDPYTGAVRLASAGHPPGLLRGADGRLEHVGAAQAPPLGYANPDGFRDETAELEVGAALVLFTDGLVEKRGRPIDEGIDHIARVLARAVSETAGEVAESLVSAAGARMALRDDVAVLVLRRVAAPQMFEVAVPARPTSVATLGRRANAWLDARGVAERERDLAVRAAEEASNDAIRRGCAGPILVRIEQDDGWLDVTVADNGPPTHAHPGQGSDLGALRTLGPAVDVRVTAAGTLIRVGPASGTADVATRGSG